MELDTLDDDELILRSRQLADSERNRVLQVLYRRYYERVGCWCLQVCRDREEAAELAQEVFMRVHTRIDGFRMDSRFSSWLYRIARNIAIDRGLARNRRRTVPLEQVREPSDPAPRGVDRLTQAEVIARFRRAIDRDLEPVEARVLYSHYVEGEPLARLTERLGLTNKSGAKAYVVSGRRKLDRKFGRWLRHYRGEAEGSTA